jgi:hypothetical protein
MYRPYCRTELSSNLNYVVGVRKHTSVSTHFIGKCAELHQFVFEISEQLNRAETGAVMASNCEIKKADKNCSS